MHDNVYYPDAMGLLIYICGLCFSSRHIYIRYCADNLIVGSGG